jgi:hypothetical protein
MQELPDYFLGNSLDALVQQLDEGDMGCQGMPSAKKGDTMRNS